MSTTTTPDQDRLLDHSYDGIQEYDNPLPGWWVGIFWATIVLVPFYVAYYHWGVGPSIRDQYAASAVAFYDEQAAAFANVEVTDESIAGQMQQKVLMEGMAGVFASKCATCHGAQAQGLACPNLTDDSWIHGGDLLSIYKTIRDGVPGKEMISWKDQLGAAGLLNMAAYIGTLRGTHAPGGKSPEGQPHVAPK